MFKYLAAAAFLGAIFLFPFTSRESLVNTVEQSVVQITGVPDEGFHSSCTGFIIAPQEVLTAAHCLASDLQVDGFDADVIKADTYVDLALLHTDTIKPALELENTPPERFQPLIAIGYAFGWNALTVFDEKALMVNVITDVDSPAAIYMEGTLAHGMSGGPIVNEQGKVVAICQQFNQGVSMGVGTLVMRAFLLGVN